MESNCDLCGRDTQTTRHHLIPKARHRNYKRRNGSANKEHHKTIDVCHDCHSNIHATISAKELAESYNTLEKLKQHQAIQRFSRWIRKQSTAKRFSSRKAKH